MIDRALLDLVVRVCRRNAEVATRNGNKTADCQY
jgi:hypothetical protein